MGIMTDSAGAIGIAKFDKINDRTKHIDVRFHFARENVMLKKVALKRVSTVENVADMFTKNLGKLQLAKLLSKMSLRMSI